MADDRRGRAPGRASPPRRSARADIRFSHALVRETLFDALSPSRGIALHRDVGEALERVYGAEADEAPDGAGPPLPRGGAGRRPPRGAHDPRRQPGDGRARLQPGRRPVRARDRRARPGRRAEDARRAPLQQAHGEALLRAGEETRAEGRARAGCRRRPRARIGGDARFARVALALGALGPVQRHGGRRRSSRCWRSRSATSTSPSTRPTPRRWGCSPSASRSSPWRMYWSTRCRGGAAGRARRLELARAAAGARGGAELRPTPRSCST